METTRRPEWTGDAVKLMHIYGITRKEVADELGVTNAYITMVLNGRQVKDTTRDRIKSALLKIIANK